MALTNDLQEAHSAVCFHYINPFYELLLITAGKLTHVSICIFRITKISKNELMRIRYAELSQALRSQQTTNGELTSQFEASREVSSRFVI